MKTHKESGDIYWNHSKTPIYICTSIIPDLLGGPGSMDHKVIIMPGQGIDLSILGLKKEKP